RLLKAYSKPTTSGQRLYHRPFEVSLAPEGLLRMEPSATFFRVSTLRKRVRKRVTICSGLSPTCQSLPKTSLNASVTSTGRVCVSYFYEGGLKRALRSLPSFDQNAESAMEHALKLLQLPPGGKVRLLDVGSCYDPFRCYEDIEAVAVDLTPASEGVLECDFLKLRVTDPSGGRWSPYVLTNPLVELPAASFQVVVLCMVLEYLPSCLQRWTFCRKAAALLRPYGLLLVVTPDSKHQQRNAAMVASWREALGNLGLPKLRYEKRQHLHCMAFYRCGPTRELSENEEAAEARKMYIPQDSRDYVALFSRVGVEERDEAGDVALGEGFSELPDCVDL
ncbi:hypothetical protein HPB47_012623, partial [Ixodes persulcatus]